MMNIMTNSAIGRLFALGLIAGLVVTGITGCDEEEDSEAAPVDEFEAGEATAETDDDGADEREEQPDHYRAHLRDQQPDMAREVTAEEIDDYGRVSDAIEEYEKNRDDDMWRARMRDAQNQQEMRDIQRAIFDEMRVAVEAEGMDFEHYMALRQRAQQDRKLQERMADQLGFELPEEAGHPPDDERPPSLPETGEEMPSELLDPPPPEELE